VKVSTLEVLVLDGLKLAVTPLGTPLADRFRLLNRFAALTTLMVLLAPLPPAATVSALEEDDRLKLGEGTVTRIVVELVAVPAVPVTITG
jgi:hypothetical protein